ncbi:MAG: hypothetical protein DMG06_01150 [Acidobacteria bacterium]|nr:MAG: hypothetical protein DMG06_01150 [Acidobacteriota bacterium]
MLTYLRNALKRLLLGVFARVGSRDLRQSRRPTKRCPASALQMRAPKMSKLETQPCGPGDASLAQILGHAIAHALGHLLTRNAVDRLQMG